MPIQATLPKSFCRPQWVTYLLNTEYQIYKKKAEKLGSTNQLYRNKIDTSCNIYTKMTVYSSTRFTSNMWYHNIYNCVINQYIVFYDVHEHRITDLPKIL